MRAWTNPGKWSVNPVNFAEEVVRDYELPDRVFVLDSTLRKMVETPGCNWTVEGAVDIAAMADEIGVEFMVVNVVYGWQAPPKRLLQMFEAVARLNRRFKLFGTAWLTRESVDLVVDHGADGVDLTRGDMLQFGELYEYARSRGVLVAKEFSVGSRIEHVPPSELARQINSVLQKDLTYVGIHENKGPTTPDAWRYYMKALRRAIVRDTILIPHIHNMFGQATAATCAAVTGGANGVDVTMNGIATDSGLGALEEVVVSLEAFYGVETGIRLEKLRDYSEVVSRATGIPVPPNKPLVGDHAFLVEYAPFVQEVLEARVHGNEHDGVHLIAPSLVGHHYILVWGQATISETGATKEKLAQMGLPHDQDAAQRLNEAIRAKIEKRAAYPRFLTEAEVEELAADLFAQPQSTVRIEA